MLVKLVEHKNSVEIWKSIPCTLGHSAGRILGVYVQNGIKDLIYLYLTNGGPILRAATVHSNGAVRLIVLLQLQLRVVNVYASCYKLHTTDTVC